MEGLSAVTRGQKETTVQGEAAGQKEAYHHGNLRSALLEAALAVLLESGPDALSLREVAKRAGVSSSAPYNHFRSKGALLAELAADRRGQAGQAFRAAMAAAGTPEERLKALGVAYVRYALAHRAEFKLMFGGALQAVGTGNALDTPILALFREPLRDAGLRGTELDDAALAAWSFVHGLAGLVIDGPLAGLEHDPAGLLRLAERVVQSLG